MLLDKIEASKDPTYIAVLEQWRQIDYRKVQQKIEKVTQSLLCRKQSEKQGNGPAPR